MLTARITALHTEAPGDEEPAATRERLRAHFAPGATRRMTQLGLLVGRTLGPLAPAADDTIVYASGYGESRALEGFLDSFPEASPTLFQTSIHPSGVQQGLIGRQPGGVRELFPLSGGPHLVAHALRVALLAPGGGRVLLCGGEERGTWLREHRVASDLTFAFALALEHTAASGDALGEIVLQPHARGDVGGLDLAHWFQLLHTRTPFRGPVAPGLDLQLTWS